MNTELNNKARIAGHEANKARKPRIPYHDANMMALIQDIKEIGESTSPLQCWLVGWDNENIFAGKDIRQSLIKTSITGCMNCNHPRGCINGSEYKRFPDTNSDACANRVFAGDDELYAYIASQHD